MATFDRSVSMSIVQSSQGSNVRSSIANFRQVPECMKDSKLNSKHFLLEPGLKVV
jgi:hypothetical protein